MPTPARLPKGAPSALRDFVACTTSRVALNLSELGWIPRPDEVPDALEPSVTIGEGATSSSATIKVGYGPFIALELPASIVDGRLRIDTGNLGFGIGPKVDEWVNAFNETLAANDRQLDGFEVDGNTITITKRAAVTPADTSSIAPATSATTATPAPEPEPDEKGTNWGCLTGIVAGVTALLVAIGVIATSGDDDTETADSVVITTDAPATSTTTAPPASPTPTTTIAQVGQADPAEPTDDAVGVAGLPTCGSPSESIDYGGTLLPDGPCEPDGPDPFSRELCATLGIPCSSTSDPPLVTLGMTGWNHVERAADANTGDIGASTWEEFARYINTLLDEGTVEVSSTCAGIRSTGAANGSPGSVIDIRGPLYQYGECADREAVLVVDGVRYRFPQTDGFVVDASQPDPVPPPDYAIAGDAMSLSDLHARFFADINTVYNAVGGAPVADDCLWFFEPGNIEQVVRVLDGCSDPGRFWVFAAATTNVEFELSVTDTVAGTTATYANPLGQPFAPVTDTNAFATSGPLFDNSVFPCGFGHIGYTACADGEPPMETGGFVTASAAVGDVVPIAGDGTPRAHHVDFGSVGGARYSITQADAGWSVSSSAGPTRARAVIRGNAITLVVPTAELPEGPLAYRWSNEADGVLHEQPEVPVVGLITTPAIEGAGELTDRPATDDETTDTSAPDTSESLESLADFYSQLSASVAAGDLGFALDRLDPRVFEVYPDSCPAALQSFADPDLVIEFVAEGPIEDWDYEANGQAIDVPGAQAVTIRLSGRGQSGEESVAHLSIVDDTYRWFTFC